MTRKAKTIKHIMIFKRKVLKRKAEQVVLILRSALLLKQAKPADFRIFLIPENLFFGCEWSQMSLVAYDRNRYTFPLGNWIAESPTFAKARNNPVLREAVAYKIGID